MAKFRILHLSDLHYQKNNKDVEQIISALLNDLKNQIKEKIDIVVFSGDLVKIGDCEESFRLAKEKFITPVLEVLKLSGEDFILTPGNHDIQLSKLNKYAEEGIYADLKSRESINSFIDNLNENKFLIKDRFNNFNNLISSLDSVSNDFSLSRERIISRDNIKFGLALINSSWRASGKGDNYDYGRLIVGERQVQHASTNLVDCSIRVACLHHPLDWLMPEDKKSVLKSMSESFDVILSGHMHSFDPSSYKSFHGSLVFLSSGCLYESRDYFNGYSILEFDSSIEVVNIAYREYFGGRNVFGASERISDGSSLTISYSKNSIDEIGPDILIDAEEVFISQANDKLLPSIAEAGAPKNIKELFVCPPLSNSPEANSLDQFEKRRDDVSLKDLLNEKNNIIFCGKKETGLSTLLSYFCALTVERDGLKGAVPCAIDFNDIGAKSESIVDAIAKSIKSTISKGKLYKLLKGGRIALGVDNVEIIDEEKITALLSFVSNYNNNKFFFSTNQTLDGEENFLKAKFGSNWRLVFVHHFTRKEVATLVEKWHPLTTKNFDIVENLCATAKRINVPYSPFLLSILLWLREQQVNFDPVNKSTLIEKFIAGLLEKIHKGSIKRSTLDKTNYEHVLSYVASRFTRENKPEFSGTYFDKILIEYFDNKFNLNDLNISVSDIRKELTEKGILYEDGGCIRFKFRCFQEYLSASWMAKDKDFYIWITGRDTRIHHKDEIDYYTAAVRNDADLLRDLVKHTDDCFVEITKGIDLSKFEELPGFIVFKKSMSRQNLLEILTDEPQETDLAGEEIDAEHSVSAIEEQRSRKKKEYGACYEPAEILELSSRVLRNSEFVDNKEIKHDFCNKAIKYWAYLLADISLQLEKALQDEDTPPEIKDNGNILKLLVIPQAVLWVMSQSIGTAKLTSIIKESAQNTSSPLIERVFACTLLIDMLSNDYISITKKLSEDMNNHGYLLNIIFIKLINTLESNNRSRHEKEDLINLILDVYEKSLAGASKQQKAFMSSQFKKTLINRGA